jgi:hypothetical protein
MDIRPGAIGTEVHETVERSDGDTAPLCIGGGKGSEILFDRR